MYFQGLQTWIFQGILFYGSSYNEGGLTNFFEEYHTSDTWTFLKNTIFQKFN